MNFACPPRVDVKATQVENTSCAFQLTAEACLCRVYVHCTAGLGRAPAVIIAYLFWFKDLGLDEVKPVTSKLTCITAYSVYSTGCLHTGAQASLLAFQGSVSGNKMKCCRVSQIGCGTPPRQCTPLRCNVVSTISTMAWPRGMLTKHNHQLLHRATPDALLVLVKMSIVGKAVVFASGKNVLLENVCKHPLKNHVCCHAE